MHLTPSSLVDISLEIRLAFFDTMMMSVTDLNGGIVFVDWLPTSLTTPFSDFLSHQN